ncbi:hypothetical protein LXL04_031482 [Taraxacum kok-saghyz]
MRRLRPCPPKVDARFTVGDIVDAWQNDGWWSARYIRRDGDNYVVKFDNMDPPNEIGSYPRRHIRFHHEWSSLNIKNNNQNPKTKAKKQPKKQQYKITKETARQEQKGTTTK